jgi:hypothetical protein
VELDYVLLKRACAPHTFPSQAKRVRLKATDELPLTLVSGHEADSRHALHACARNLSQSNRVSSVSRSRRTPPTRLGASPRMTEPCYARCLECSPSLLPARGCFSSGRPPSRKRRGGGRPVSGVADLRSSNEVNRPNSARRGRLDELSWHAFVVDGGDERIGCGGKIRYSPKCFNAIWMPSSYIFWKLP